MREVETVRDISVDFHVISLAVLNEEKQDQQDPGTIALWQGARASLAVRERHGATKVADFYTAAGTLIHNQGFGVDRYDEVLPAALQEIGIDDAQDILEAITTDTYDEGLRTSTRNALDLVGNDVGTPVIAVGDTAFFGPVITRIPRGEEAGKLWDGFQALLNYPYFYELKRARTTSPEFE